MKAFITYRSKKNGNYESKQKKMKEKPLENLRIVSPRRFALLHP